MYCSREYNSLTTYGPYTETFLGPSARGSAWDNLVCAGPRLVHQDQTENTVSDRTFVLDVLDIDIESSAAGKLKYIVQHTELSSLYGEDSNMQIIMQIIIYKFSPNKSIAVTYPVWCLQSCKHAMYRT
jgi:hypothetical protein